MNSYETDLKNKLIISNYVARSWESVHEGNRWRLKFDRNYPTAHAINKGNWTARSIWNQKYEFKPKLHDMRFNYHFITSILKSPKYGTW